MGLPRVADARPNDPIQPVVKEKKTLEIENKNVEEGTQFHLATS